MKYNPHDVLIIRYSSLGDVILTSGPIQALGKAFPDANIILTTKQQYESAIKYFPGISRYILFPENGNLVSFIKYIGELRKIKFDLIVDLHNSLRSRIIIKFLRYRKLLIYDSERVRRKSYLSHKTEVKEPYRHTTDLYLSAIASFISPDTSTKHPILLYPNNIDITVSITIGIITPTKHLAKRWLPRYFLELVNVLLDNNFRIKIICDDYDKEYFTRFNNLESVEVFVQPDLSILIEEISLCRLVVSGDSGPMHIAEALSIPVVAIFGPTHPILGFYPLGEKDKVVMIDAECSPCSLHGEKKCRRESRICMEDLKPQVVIKAISEILEQNLRG